MHILGTKRKSPIRVQACSTYQTQDGRLCHYDPLDGLVHLEDVWCILMSTQSLVRLLTYRMSHHHTSTWYLPGLLAWTYGRPHWIHLCKSCMTTQTLWRTSQPSMYMTAYLCTCTHLTHDRQVQSHSFGWLMALTIKQLVHIACTLSWTQSLLLLTSLSISHLTYVPVPKHQSLNPVVWLHDTLRNHVTRAYLSSSWRCSWPSNVWHPLEKTLWSMISTDPSWP